MPQVQIIVEKKESILSKHTITVLTIHVQTPS